MYLFFVHSYVASKNGKETNDGIKEELLESLIYGKIEFTFGQRKKLWKKTMFVKECEKLLNVRRKESSIWRISKEFYLKNPKSLLNLKKYIRKIE